MLGGLIKDALDNHNKFTADDLLNSNFDDIETSNPKNNQDTQKGSLSNKTSRDLIDTDNYKRDKDKNIKDKNKNDVFGNGKYIKWFYEIKKGDIREVGGKAENLGIMFKLKLPVPPGFVITTKAFDDFLSFGNLNEKIQIIIESIDLENIDELNSKTQEIRELIINQKMPEKMRQEILEAYNMLSTEKIDRNISEDALTILKNTYEPIFVSVRSSATTEDLADASFAGQQESFLNVKGDRSLIENVKKCFASLYTARALYYRSKKGFDKTSSLAAIVQKMINSDKSGVIFSRDPVTLNDEIVIEAVFGLGEGVVSGRINPDGYVISRDLKIKDIKIRNKKIAIIRTGSGETEQVTLNHEKANSRVLSNAHLLELGDYAKKIEDYFKKPQDIEFAVENDDIYILQSRPITTLDKKTERVSIQGAVILQGLGASPGIGVGIVKIVNTMADLDKIKKGDVLVTKMTNPDMVVSMQKANAIVTDEGGLTSHASIVSREMGIPAVVGTDKATKILKDGMKITVDGKAGKIYEGEVAKTSFAEIKPIVKSQSRIKLKLILDIPDFAERAAQTGIDSIGLLRLEGIIASSGKHPLMFEKSGKLDEYTKILEHGIGKISEFFNSIWIRTSDIRSDEYSTLEGAPKERELNPMLGNHGIRFSLKHLKLFEAELQAIKNIALKYTNKKFGVMFPQVISIEEIKKAKQVFNKFKTSNMEIGAMIETPSACMVIDEICNEVKFISFGTNDLTQFTLAIDRNNEEVQYLYNEMHPGVLSLIKRVLGSCRRNKVESSICGQAGSNRDMVKFLIRKGINSISVNADAAYDVSLLIKDMYEDRFGRSEIDNFKQRPYEENKRKYSDENEDIDEDREEEKEQESEEKNNEYKEEQQETKENEYMSEDKLNIGVYNTDEPLKDRYEDYKYKFDDEDKDEFSEVF